MKSQDEEDCERMWFYLLEALLRLSESQTRDRQNIYRQQEVYKRYQLNIGRVFTGIFKDVKLKSVVEHIKDSGGQLELEQLQKSVQTLLSNY